LEISINYKTALYRNYKSFLKYGSETWTRGGEASKLILKLKFKVRYIIKWNKCLLNQVVQPYEKERRNEIT